MNSPRFATLLGAIACTTMLSLSPATAQAQKTMYEKFGGKEGVAKIVDDFVGFVAADTRINFQFGKTDIPHLKAMLNDQLCAATGGGCEYRGRDMKTAHAGMGVTNAQFNALVEDMQLAWEKNKVPYHLQNKLAAILAPMQKDIVTK
jgi:hemoglobin